MGKRGVETVSKSRLTVCGVCRELAGHLAALEQPNNRDFCPSSSGCQCQVAPGWQDRKASLMVSEA